MKVQLFCKQKYLGEDTITQQSNQEEMVNLENDMNAFLLDIKDDNKIKKIYVALSDNMMMGLIQYTD